jgi:hypothetical protein
MPSTPSLGLLAGPDMLPSLVWLELLVGYLVCGLIGLFGLLVLWRMYEGKIDLTMLISEKTGTGSAASMSRFQFLIFTFVIALSLFLIVIAHAKLLQTPENISQKPSPTMPQLPDVPGGVLALLGISASSYTVSKAIQSGTDQKKPEGQ